MNRGLTKPLQQVEGSAGPSSMEMPSDLEENRADHLPLPSSNYYRWSCMQPAICIFCRASKLCRAQLRLLDVTEMVRSKRYLEMGLDLAD